jgi:hypothetical protein
VIAPLFLAALAFACPASTVRKDTYAGEPAPLHGVPWLATTNGAFAGHLFYWSPALKRAHGPRAAIYTTSFWRRGNEHPKVLWIARRPTRAPRITIVGRRLDAPGSFRRVEHAADGSPPQYPSYVEIPAAGCWRVTVSAGRLRGSVVFAAYDR